jgi:hypothetical protein
MNSGKGRWLLSKRASSLFFASSVVVLTTGFLLIVLGEIFKFTITREPSASPGFYMPLAIILTANALCAFFLLVGMPWYWMRFDNLRGVAKLLWLGSFLALGWYSMSIYYFFVYRRQRRFARGAIS